MRILGIDPGLCVTGWGVIEDGYRVTRAQPDAVHSSTICGVADVTDIVSDRGRGVKPLSYIAHGVIKTRPSDDLGTRLNHIFQEVSEVVGQYHPDVGAIEDLYVNAKNPRSTLKLGAARGVALVAMSRPYDRLNGGPGLRVSEFTPTIVKKVVSGYGLADKDLVANRVRLILGQGCPAVTKDAADALAIAICGSCKSCPNQKMLSAA